jgi:hypothetical protein
MDQVTPIQSQAHTAERNSLPRAKWAQRIADAWQKQVPSIFETALLLESAKAELRRGEWMAMVKADLPFSHSTVNKLIKIAACDHLRNSEHVPRLPAHWGTLFELTLLSREQFDHGIKTGKITPKMQRKDVRALRSDEQTVRGEYVSPMALLKRQVVDLQEKLAHADPGSLFDLEKDSARNIAATVLATISESKALALADAIKAAVKAKHQPNVDHSSSAALRQG